MWMVNLMKYRDVAEYADGRESSISGSEADDLYSPLDSLAAVGARPVLFGDVDQQLLGEDTVWDRIAVVKYPTRKSFIDMQALPNVQGITQTQRCRYGQHDRDGNPVRSPNRRRHPVTTQVDWADVPHPPTDDDGPVVVVHVLRFHDAEAAHTTPTHMEQYQTEAAKVSLGHGLRLNGWFAVEGTIIGDGRAWHQVRFNEFPSKAAFMAVVTDPSSLAAQKDHREVAIADTYTMIVRAQVNVLTDSITTP